MNPDKTPNQPTREPLITCLVGACLCADRQGDNILIYQSDAPEVTIKVTQAELDQFVAEATKLNKTAAE